MPLSLATRLAAYGITTKICSDPDWGTYSSTYNTHVPVVPALVALPQTIEQVSRVVIIAAQEGFKVQTRSGGHSYASHSNGGVDGCVVIDMRHFTNINLKEDGIVCVGSGVRLGMLGLALFENGRRALAHGTCPTVGVGGHFTHGGFGFTSRAWGLATDQIVALDVVMADGQIIKASEQENAQIYMAMRGAASSFGVAVNFYLHTRPAPETILKWSVDLSVMLRDVENATAAFEHIQHFVNNTYVVDRKLGLVVFLTHNRFVLEGTYLGEFGDFASGVLPILLLKVRGERGIKVKIQQLDWLTLMRAVAGDTPLEVSDDHVEKLAFFAKSAAVSHPGLSRDVVMSYFQHLLSKGPSVTTSYFIGIQLYGGSDSQITVPAMLDSLSKRDALWMFQHHASVPDGEKLPEDAIQFVRGLNEALGPGHGASNNYADASLQSGEAQELYYGKKLGELMALKTMLDPRNIFSHPQSIRGAKLEDDDVHKGVFY